MKKNQAENKKSLLDMVFMIGKVKFAVVANIMLISILVHNFMYGIAGKKESFFFTLSMLSIVYFVLMAVYTVFFDVIKKGKK